MRMSTILATVASVVAMFGPDVTQEAAAQTSIKAEKPVVIDGPGKGEKTLLLYGSTSLDKTHSNPSGLTIVLKDPNGGSIPYALDKIAWTKPEPGKTSAFSGTSPPLTVFGAYEYTITFTYSDELMMPQMAKITGSCQVE